MPTSARRFSRPYRCPDARERDDASHRSAARRAPRRAALEAHVRAGAQPRELGRVLGAPPARRGLALGRAQAPQDLHPADTLRLDIRVDGVRDAARLPELQREPRLHADVPARGPRSRADAPLPRQPARRRDQAARRASGLCGRARRVQGCAAQRHGPAALRNRARASAARDEPRRRRARCTRDAADRRADRSAAVGSLSGVSRSSRVIPEGSSARGRGCTWTRAASSIRGPRRPGDRSPRAPAWV